MLSKSGINLFNLCCRNAKLPNVRLGLEHSYILSHSPPTSWVCQRKFYRKLRTEKLQKEFFEDNQKEYEDTFGNLSEFGSEFARIKEDSEDIEQYKRDKNAQGKTILQYIREIKQHLDNHDYKKALAVLEIDVVNDRKKNVLFLYKMMISYNARQGNIEEAYRLYTQYKKRYKPLTSPIFTSLFNACANCKNSLVALQKADAVREFLLNHKHFKPNITNYNAMLKAYGRHGDLNTVLKIFDEVLEKRGKVKAETCSFVLQACISDSNSGLRHALILWRKMLQNRILPEIYQFNLLLRCVRDCSIGEPALFKDAVDQILIDSQTFLKSKVVIEKHDGVEQRVVYKIPASPPRALLPDSKVENEDKFQMKEEHSTIIADLDVKEKSSNPEEESSLESVDRKNNEDNYHKENFQIEFVEGKLENNENSLTSDNKLNQEDGMLPNLLSLKPTVGSVMEFRNMTTPQERFMCLGGLEGFLKTMSEFKTKPDIKTFTLLLDVLPPCEESIQKIMDLVRSYKLKFDTSFFNRVIYKRHLRSEEFLIKDALKEMQKEGLSPDILTFKCLSFSCDTYESGMKLIETIRNFGFRPDNNILITLLKNAGHARDMKYVNAILEAAKEDEVQPDVKFVAILRSIVDKEKALRRREDMNNSQGVEKMGEIEKTEEMQQSTEESVNKISEEKVVNI